LAVENALQQVTSVNVELRSSHVVNDSSKSLLPKLDKRWQCDRLSFLDFLSDEASD